MSISAIVLTKNEEKLLPNCLKSLELADEIIIIDSFSSDSTLNIAKKFTDKIFQINEQDFSQRRNFAISKSACKWLLYIDADERVTNELREEILKVTENDSNNDYSYAIPRKNIMFGKWLKYGGWYPDYQTRLFRKNNLKSWYGKLHESPKFIGKVNKLNNNLIHLTHRNIEMTLAKKIDWSSLEAEERLKLNHPKITWPRIIKVMISEFLKRYITLKGFMDGTEGIIASIDEAVSMFVIYSRLWELQKK